MSVSMEDSIYLMNLLNAIEIEQDHVEQVRARNFNLTAVEFRNLHVIAYHLRIVKEGLSGLLKPDETKKSSSPPKAAYRKYQIVDKPTTKAPDLTGIALKALPSGKEVDVEKTNSKKTKNVWEMTAEEIGEDTILYDLEGTPWRTSIWHGDKLDLKSLDGKNNKLGREPSELVGYTLRGQFLGEEIAEILSKNPDAIDEKGFAGYVAATIVLEMGLSRNPIFLINRVAQLIEERAISDKHDL